MERISLFVYTRRRFRLGFLVLTVFERMSSFTHTPHRFSAVSAAYGEWVQARPLWVVSQRVRQRRVSRRDEWIRGKGSLELEQRNLQGYGQLHGYAPVYVCGSRFDSEL